MTISAFVNYWNGLPRDTVDSFKDRLDKIILKRGHV